MTTWDDKPNDYEHALVMLRFQRNAVIEECARVCEQEAVKHRMATSWAMAFQDAAAAIRALKDKT